MVRLCFAGVQQHGLKPAAILQVVARYTACVARYVLEYSKSRRYVATSKRVAALLRTASSLAKALNLQALTILRMHHKAIQHGAREQGKESS